MDVRCPQCQTLYELDERRVSTGPVTLKCSQCQHVFKLEGRIATVQENTRRWMIRRQKSGDILYLNSFETLHEWIMKRECRKDDEISRTGNRWATLGAIPEFGPLFSVVESISALEGSTVSSIATRLPTAPHRNEQPTPPSMPAATAAAPRERVRTSLQYADPPRQQRAEDITKRVGSTGPALPPSPRAAPAAASAAPATTDSGLEEDSWTVDLSSAPPELETTTAYAPRPAKKRSSARIWIAGLALLAAAAGTALAAHFDVLPFEREPAKKVVAIGQPETPKVVASPDPVALVDEALGASLTAAHDQNEAIWTMWHDLASAPFYIALDTAYAAADTASVGVQLDQRIRDARGALENGKLNQANAAFRQILAQHPRNSSAISGLGWTLHALGRTDDAAEEFRRAIDINPEEGDAYIGLGTVLRRLGDERGAYDAYDRYLGRFPRGDKASIASYQMEQLRRQLGL